jgi:DNA/RNA endonuclease YhcR with UshA esterase domain
MRAIRVVLGMGLLMLFAGNTPLTVGADKTPIPHETYTYDITNQHVVTGTVVDVQDYACPVSGTVGSHITVRHAGGNIEVHLAPAKFLKQYEIVINKGDLVKIEGADTTVDGKPALLAKIVADGTSTFAFRDSKGRPLW